MFLQSIFEIFFQTITSSFASNNFDKSELVRFATKAPKGSAKFIASSENLES